MSFANDYSCIKLSEKAGVVYLKLNRPERLNALSKTMHVELKQALDEIESFEDLLCLVITGEGRGFCSGQDLEERRVPADQPKPDLGESLRNSYSPLVLRLRNLPVPVVAAVNGVAAGGGAALALACDIVIAKKNAKLTFPFSNLGLVPDTGATATLVRNAGQARAIAITMLGEVLSGEEAADLGLIWKAVDEDQFDSEVEEVISRLGARPRLGLELIKRCLYQAFDNDYESQLELEAVSQKSASQNPEYWSRVQQFLDKR